MKRLKNKLNKGFTLIELMVVISIIALLSSVVLVALKDARDKAKANAFRASVNQFINALELYRADKGVYLGYVSSSDYNFGFLTRMNLDGSIESYLALASKPSFPDYNSYVTALKPYIKTFPKPILPGTYFIYRQDVNVNRCYGDSTARPYVVLVTNQPGFEDWSYSFNPFSPTVPSTDFRCFSLK